MDWSAEEIPQLTEKLIQQLLKHSDSNGENIVEKSNAVVQAVKQLAENHSKERQHAAAMELHVDQLEKIIARLRNDRIPQGSFATNRNAPPKLTLLESEVDSLHLQLQECDEKITILSDDRDAVINELENVKENNRQLQESCEALLVLKEQMSGFEEANVRLEEKLYAAEQLNAELRKEIQAADTNVVSVQEQASQKLQDMQSQIDEKNGALVSMANDAAVYRDILEQFSVHMSSGLDVFSSHVSESLGGLVRESNRLSVLQQSVYAVQGSLMEKDVVISNLTKEVATKDDAIEALLNEKKTLTENLSQQSIQLVHLQERIKNLDHAIVHLEKQKRAAENLLLVKDSELHDLVIQLEDAQNKAHLVSEGFDTISEKLEEYKGLTENLKEELAVEQSKFSEAENRFLHQVEEVSHHQNEIARLQSIMSEYQGKTSEYEAKIADHTSSALHQQQSLSSKLLVLEGLVEEKTAELGEIKANFDNERLDWQKMHQNEMSALQSEIDTLQMRIQEIDKLLPELHFQLTEAHRGRLAFSEQSADLETKLVESEETVKRLEQRSGELEAKLAAKETVSSRLEQCCNEMETKIAERESALDRLEQELEAKEKTIADLQVDGTVAHSSVEQFRLDAMEKEQKLNGLVEECERLTKQNHQLDSKLGVLMGQLVERNEEVDELGNRVLQLEKEVEFAHNQLTNSQSETTNQLASLDNVRRELEGKLSEEIRQNVELGNRIEQLEREVEWARNQLTNSETETASRIDGVRQDLENRLAEEAREKESALATVRKLEDSLGQQVASFEDCKAKLNESSVEVDRMSQMVAANGEERKLLQEALNERSADVEAASHSLAEVQKQLEVESRHTAELRSLKDELQEHVNRLTQELTTKSSGIQHLEEEKQTLFADLQSAYDRNRYYESELNMFASLLSSLGQFLEAKYGQIWAKVDALAARVVSLQGKTGLIVEAYRSVCALVADVKLLVKTLNTQQGPLFDNFMASIGPVFAGLDGRIEGLQKTFCNLTDHFTTIQTNSTLLESSLREDITSLSNQLSQERSLHSQRNFNNIHCQTVDCLVDISELEALQDILDSRDAELDHVTKEVTRLSHRPVKIDSDAQTTESWPEQDADKVAKLQASVGELECQIKSRDEQLKSFSDELQVLNNERQRLLVEHDNTVKSAKAKKKALVDGGVQTTEAYIAPEDFEQLEAALGETEGHLAFCEQQLQSANQQILELVEEAKSHRDAMKRAERRFVEADSAAKSLAADGQNMAGIVQNVRERLKMTEEKLAATEIARVQLAEQLTVLQATYAAEHHPVNQNIEKNSEAEAECDRLRNKVKFMTDQFELAVSRSALLERSLHEKEEQCERLSQELSADRQRLQAGLAAGTDLLSTPSSVGGHSPSREMSPISNGSHTTVDLRQYYESLPEPVQRAFERVRHSNAAAATLSASKQFKRIVRQSPMVNAFRQVSLRFQHQVLGRLSPAKLQFIITIYVCVLHLVTIFYMFTCYSSPKIGSRMLDAAPHLQIPEDILSDPVITWDAE